MPESKREILINGFIGGAGTGLAWGTILLLGYFLLPDALSHAIGRTASCIVTQGTYQASPPTN